MGLFRRRDETYNERMLREAGLVDEQRDLPYEEELTPEFDPFPGPSPTDLHGTNAGPREWDAATTAVAPGLPGERVAFISLSGGDLIIEEEDGSGDLSPLADAIKQHVAPPYRAVAERQVGDLWGIGAKRIEVARIEDSDGDTLELCHKDTWQELRVDGEPSDGRIPYELQQLGERAGADFYVKAERIDADLWEVRVTAL